MGCFFKPSIWLKLTDKFTQKSLGGMVVLVHLERYLISRAPFNIFRFTLDINTQKEMMKNAIIFYVNHNSDLSDLRVYTN